MKTFLFFSHNIDFALGWMVVHSLWQATLIAVVTGLILISLRKKSAQLHYSIANIALFSVLVCAAITFFYYLNLAQRPGQLSFVPDVSRLVSQSVSQLVQDQPTNRLTDQPTNYDFKTYFNRNLPLIVSLWLLGVTVFLLRLMGGITYIQYLRRRMNFPPDEYWLELKDKILQTAGVNRAVELVESALVRTPMVIGHLKPMILFPIGVMNRLSSEEVEAILSHEIAHIFRNDYIVNIAQNIVEALFYFHPAVWWLSNQVRNARESCCDDLAIQLCGSSMNYAKALVVVQDMNFYPLSPSLAFAGQQKNQLLMRVQRIIHPSSQSTSNIMEKTIAVGVLLALVVSLSFTTQKNKNSDLLSKISASKISATESVSENLSKLNFVLDSLPANTENGTYNFSDNTQDIQLKVENNKPIAMTINGVEIPEKDLVKFDALANKIVNRSGNSDFGVQPPIPPTPPTPPTSPTPPDWNFSVPIPPTPPTPPTASLDGNLNINIGDEDGHFMMRTDKDGNFSMSAGDKKDNSNFSMFAGKNGFTMFSSDGKGKGIFTQSNGDMVINGDEGEKVTIKSHKGSGQSTVITEKGDERTEIESTKGGNTKIKIFKNNQLQDELEVKDKKIFLNGKEATDEDLRKHGYMRCANCGNNNGPGINKIGGFNNIQLGKNFERDLQNDIQMNINENLQESMRDMNKDINESLKDLKIDLKDCEVCTGAWKENFAKQMSEFKFKMGDFNDKMKNFKFQNKEQFQAKIGEMKGRLEGLKSELEMRKSQIEMEKNRFEMQKSQEEMQKSQSETDQQKLFRGNNDFQSNFGNITTAIVQQFIADGLIKDPEQYKFSWNKKGLIIDGKKISDDVEKIYEKRFHFDDKNFEYYYSRSR